MDKMDKIGQYGRNWTKLSNWTTWKKLDNVEINWTTFYNMDKKIGQNKKIQTKWTNLTNNRKKKS